MSLLGRWSESRRCLLLWSDFTNTFSGWFVDRFDASFVFTTTKTLFVDLFRKSANGLLFWDTYCGATLEWGSGVN